MENSRAPTIPPLATSSFPDIQTGPGHVAYDPPERRPLNFGPAAGSLISPCRSRLPPLTVAVVYPAKYFWVIWVMTWIAVSALAWSSLTFRIAPSPRPCSAWTRMCRLPLRVRSLNGER